MPVTALPFSIQITPSISGKRYSLCEIKSTMLSFASACKLTNACFSVSDNGVGIPKERLSTIFNGGLSGVSHNNFDMKKNMGIGLSVCYTIVKAHGGTMTAENLDLGGACFRFYLPLEEGINSEIEG